MRPQDAYGISKLEAEQLLFRITRGTDTQAVVLRPPLVYGPRVRGNLLRLPEWTRRGLPFPFSSIRNRRSLVQVDNLADAVVSVAEHPLAAGEVFHVADDSPLSTPDLLATLARFQGRPSRLFPCPSYVLRALGWLLGQEDEIHRLTNSLVVSNQRLRRRLGWYPRYNTSQGLEEMAHWF